MATVSPDTQAGLYPPRPTQTTASPSSHPPAISSGSASVGESPGEKEILATFIYDHIVEGSPLPPQFFFVFFNNNLVQSAPQRWCDSGESIAAGCVLCQHRPWTKGSQFLGNICIDASIRAKYTSLCFALYAGGLQVEYSFALYAGGLLGPGRPGKNFGF